MIEIEINGQKLQAEPGAMIIQVADKAGMYIPRFCYHKKLSVAASCRMCLVEVAGARKPLPACATPITAGMKVFTESPAAIDAQRAVMEFLLINHPLDCPICDQGGECELQDISVGYGGDISQYNQGKRVVEDKSIGPLVETEMTRCILCSRCVRFGTEIAGCREIGVVGRGEHSEITTYLEQYSMESELSGNIIDLCPVGALTNKPYRYSARAWELTQSPTIAAHDCVGSHIFTHTYNGVVKRVVAKDCEAINETWIADRDRYSCFGLYHTDRLTQPEIKINGVWQVVDWDTALNTASQRLRNIVDTQGPEQVGGLLSASSTVEEAYLFQRWLRGLGCHNIDHRLRQQDFADDVYQPAYPGLLPGSTLADIAQCKAALVIGAQLRKDQPIINHRLRQAALKGAKVYFINPVAFPENFTLAGESITTDLIQEMLALAKCVARQTQQPLPTQWQTATANVTVTELQQEIIATLVAAQGQQALLLLGTLALHHPQASVIRGIAAWIRQQLSIAGGSLTEGANSAGAWLAGAVPQRLAAGKPNAVVGLDAATQLQQPRKAYVLLGVEPELDSAHSAHALHAVTQADCVIALTAFTSAKMREYADVLLPIGTFTETAGTFVNLEGKWQSFTGVAKPWGESRPAWKILRVLGNLAQLPGFDYITARDVLTEVQGLCADITTSLPNYSSLTFDYAPQQASLIRIAPTPLYSVDSLVRRSLPLQSTHDAQVGLVSLHPALAARLNVQAGEWILVTQAATSISLPVKIDSGVPINAVLLPAAIAATVGLGANFAGIELSRVDNTLERTA